MSLHVFYFPHLSLYHLSSLDQKYLFSFIFLPNWNSCPPFLSVFQQDPLPFEDDTVVEQIAISLPFSLFSAPSLSIFNPSINAYVPHSIFHCSSYLCPISFIFATDCLSFLSHWAPNKSFSQHKWQAHRRGWLFHSQTMICKSTLDEM